MLGQTFSHYRILEQLGEGGMGVVYKAQDLVLERVVALKVMNATALADPSLRARFLQEARSAAVVHHPNIATIFEAGDADGTAFIAMEYVQGESLKSRLERPLPLPEALAIAADIATGLAHAHTNQVVHRDLKPANILIGPDGHAKILDFGLAKIVRPGPLDTSLTQAATVAAGVTMRGEILGSPAYMSPEQARGAEVDLRSDIFSFGCILHEMATGQRAFGGASALEVLSAILHVAPTPPSRIDARLPPGLDRVIGRCLEKDPAARYGDTRDLVRDLLELAGEAERGVSGRGAARRTPGRAGRRRAPVLLTALGLAVLGAGLGILRPWELVRSPKGSGGGGAEAASGRPNWILVADFVGTGVAPELAVATRELVAAALAQSAVVTPIPHDRVVRGLRNAGKPDTTRVVGEVAGELAFRAAARTWVAGRIDKVLSGYSLVVDVIDTESRLPAITVRGVAENDAAVITTLDALARDLRQKLGERSRDVRTTRKLRETLTPDFEAFKSYAQAMELQNARQYRPSIQILRRALAADPDFGAAWLAMGTNYFNLGFPDSARQAFDAARRKPDRMNEGERLAFEILFATIVDFDLQKAVDLYDALARERTLTATQSNNRGTVLFNLGRYEEALDAQRRAAELEPFGATELILFNEFHTLMQLGRWEEATALSERLTGPAQNVARLELAVAKGEWDQAEGAARTDATSPRADLAFQAKLLLAALAAQRGAVESAARELAGLEKLAPNPFWRDEANTARIHLTFLAGLESPVEPAAPDTSTSSWIVRGIAAAARGDTASAARCRSAVRRKSGADLRRYATDAALLDGWIAFATGAWNDATLELETAMTAGPGPWFVGRPAIRWLVAQAYEKAGRIDDAIRAYDLVLSSERQHHDVWTWRALLLPFAHQRLAVLQAGAGRPAEARRHLEALEAAWRTPDAVLQGALEAARRATAGAS